MFFYRYRVAEAHLNKHSGWLYQQYLLGRTSLVATSSPNLVIHKIFDKRSDEWMYFVVDTAIDSSSIPTKLSRTPHPAILGFCALEKIPRWVALETTMLYVNPLSRGRGIATLIYDAIMKDGVIVMSGFSHNIKSRKLWMNIVQNPKYTAWAHDIINLDSYAAIYVEDGLYKCALKLYEDIKKMRRRRKYDVRIIAFNPRYVK